MCYYSLTDYYVNKLPWAHSPAIDKGVTLIQHV